MKNIRWGDEVMPYELDFIGVNKETKDADAVGIRWEITEGNYVIGVFDGGFQKHGEALKNIINNYYLKDKTKKVLDFVICSHSDQDHASGLIEILNNFEVKDLYMNRPWLYAKELIPYVDDGRITEESLKKRLKEKYVYIAELEVIALNKGIKIHEIFQGEVICDKLQVLSPTKELYKELLIESSKTPLVKEQTIFDSIRGAIVEFLKNLIESWDDEKLKEDVETTAENEMSTIILGEMEEESFLLTGDAGIRGLKVALDYADTILKDIKDNVTIYQIPHHGGRHNVSTSILNRLIGNIVEEGNTTSKKAFVCSGKNSDHPLQMVVNAFVRRGVKVYNASGKTINHRNKISSREGWSSTKTLEFNKNVEDWDD